MVKVLLDDSPGSCSSQMPVIYLPEAIISGLVPTYLLMLFYIKRQKMLINLQVGSVKSHEFRITLKWVQYLTFQGQNMVDCVRIFFCRQTTDQIRFYGAI